MGWANGRGQYPQQPWATGAWCDLTALENKLPVGGAALWRTDNRSPDCQAPSVSRVLTVTCQAGAPWVRSACRIV